MSVLAFACALMFWSDPGNVAIIDFSRPAHGAPEPTPPLQFVSEESGGTSPKLLVRDSAGIIWQMKGGDEARSEAFVTRLIAATGFFAEANVFLTEGRVENMPPTLNRSAGFIRRDGTFSWVVLERRDPNARFLPDAAWKWTDEKAREVRALKVMVMLVSNWDNKDGRDRRKGPNTGVMETAHGSFGFVTDWGQSMGAWGRWPFGRSQWNCRDYAVQTPEFVRGRDREWVRFGFAGQHTRDFVHDISVDDVRWLLRTLGKITDAQIRTGLLASGATPAEEQCFSRALRDRIDALQRVTMNSDVHLDLPEVRR